MSANAVQTFLKSRDFSKLLVKGKDQAYLTPEDIHDAIPASIVDVESMDLILTNLSASKIEIQVQAEEENEEEKEKIR